MLKKLAILASTLSIFLGACAAVPPVAEAQVANVVTTCGTIPHVPTNGTLFYMDINGNLCTSAAISASISGFHQTSKTSFATRTATGTSSQVALPPGSEVIIFNIGTNVGSINVGDNTVTASATTTPIQPGSWFAQSISTETTLAAYSAAGTSFIILGGDGIPTGSGGGSSGGGSGGDVNITAVGGNSVTTTVPVSGTITAEQATAANLNAKVVGTGTFAVQNTAATPAGTNLIGKMGIDQTTPGTTNGVVDTAVEGNTSSIASSVSGVAQDATISGAQGTFGSTVANKMVLYKGDGTLVDYTGPTDTNLTQLGGSAIASGNGTTNAQTQRVTLSSDSTGTVASSQSGTWTVQPGNTANTTPWLVKAPDSTPSTTLALTNTVVTVAASAAHMRSYVCGNLSNSSPTYIQIFNVSGSVTLGSTAPNAVITLPANSAANIAGLDWNFSNAIKVAATTTANGSTAPSSSVNCTWGTY